MNKLHHVLLFRCSETVYLANNKTHPNLHNKLDPKTCHTSQYPIIQFINYGKLRPFPSFTVSMPEKNSYFKITDPEHFEMNEFASHNSKNKRSEKYKVVGWTACLLQYCKTIRCFPRMSQNMFSLWRSQLSFRRSRMTMGPNHAAPNCVKTGPV
jgi:hypothetical protein